MAKDLHGSCRSSQHSAFSLCAPADGRRSAADGRRKVVKNSRVVFQESAQGSRFQRLQLLLGLARFRRLGISIDEFLQDQTGVHLVAELRKGETLLQKSRGHLVSLRISTPNHIKFQNSLVEFS